MNPNDKITGCKYFTWKEALWLPKWNRMADESDGLTEEILETIKITAQWMDQIREYLGAPISVHCWYRPEAYNALVKGAKSSTHLFGKAVDFHAKGITCDEVKQKILADKKLDELNLRMEDNGAGAGWIHLDDREPGPGGRFFKP